MRRREQAGNAGTYLRLAAVPVIWGGTFIAGRVLALALPATIGSLLRFLVASMVLLAAARLLEGPLPRLDRRQLAATIALGATGVFAYNLFFLGALARLPASRTSLIVALNPAVTIAVSAWLFREPVGPLRWFGVMLALTGVWIVISRGDPFGSLAGAVGPGELMMFGAVCAWAAFTLIGRSVLGSLTPLAATAYASLFGTAMLAIAAAPGWRSADLATLAPAAMAAVLYLGILGTGVAFVWYYRAVQRLGPSRTVIFNNLVPVFGAAFGVVLLDEPLLPSMLLGGAIAVAGVMIVSRGRP
jgi:drug/metabolite transporter (DMT)-like permease